jgi:hypothetical protein
VRDPAVFACWTFFTNETNSDRMDCASRQPGCASTNSKMLLNNTSESYHKLHRTIGYCARFFSRLRMRWLPVAGSLVLTKIILKKRVIPVKKSADKEESLVFRQYFKRRLLVRPELIRFAYAIPRRREPIQDRAPGFF